MDRAKNAWGIARVAQHERRWAWPLFAASLIWFGSLTAVWVEQHPDAMVRRICAFALAATWVWFIVDFLARLVLAGPDRREFVRTRVFELASISIPFLRPFMILVFVWRLPVPGTESSGARNRLRVRYALMTVLFSFLLVYVGSYLVWAAEKDSPHATIVNFGDAIWWGFTTITTVGYGDFVPVTLLGRTLAVGLMVGSIVVLGVTTGTVVSGISDQLKRLATRGAAAEHRPQTPDGGGEEHGHGAVDTEPALK